MNWEQLTYVDKRMFRNSQTVFLEKKMLFFDNVELIRKMRAIHTLLSTTAEGDDLKALAAEIVEMDIQRNKNWKKIDAQ